MGEHKTGRTRGAHGRGLALDTVLDAGGFGTFVCPSSEQKGILLKNEKKYVIDGEVIKEKHVWAKFIAHTWVARSQEQLDLMKQHPAYRRGTVKLLGEAKEEDLEQKASRLAKEIASNPELAAAVDALKKGPGDEPVVAPKAPPKSKSDKKAAATKK